MDLQSDDAVTTYRRELALIRPLTKHEEAKLFEELRNRNERADIAERRLIESKLSLVVSVAERHSSTGIPLLDLIQEGNLGLFNAVKTFAQSGSDDFTDHVSACIERAILQAIATSK